MIFIINILIGLVLGVSSSTYCAEKDVPQADKIADIVIKKLAVHQAKWTCTDYLRYGTVVGVCGVVGYFYFTYVPTKKDAQKLKKGIFHSNKEEMHGLKNDVRGEIVAVKLQTDEVDKALSQLIEDGKLFNEKNKEELDLLKGLLHALEERTKNLKKSSETIFGEVRQLQKEGRVLEEETKGYIRQDGNNLRRKINGQNNGNASQVPFTQSPPTMLSSSAATPFGSANSTHPVLAWMEQHEMNGNQVNKKQ